MVLSATAIRSSITCFLVNRRRGSYRSSHDLHDRASNKFPDEGNQRIRLLVACGLAGPDGGNGLRGNFLEGLGNRAVSSDAVAAFIFQACGEQRRKCAPCGVNDVLSHSASSAR